MCTCLQLFKQLCHDAGCPLEDGVFKRSRHSPTVKDEAPEWIPDAGLPRHRKTKRKADSLYSYDSSDTERDTSHARAAAAAAAAAAAVPTTGLDLSDRAAAVARSGLMSLGGGSYAGDMQDSGSSGEDLSHKPGRMTHSTNLLQQQHPQPLQLMGYTLDPAAAAAAIRGVDTILLSPHCSTGPNPLGAATSAGMGAANGSAAAAAAMAAAAAGRESSGLDVHRQPAVGTSVGRLSDDAVRGLMHLKASSPTKPAPASTTAAPSPAAAAAAAAAAQAAGPVMSQALNLGSFQQQQQQQQQPPPQRPQQQQQQEDEEEDDVPLPPRQQQQPPALTVSTGRGRGRPRGRPPTRGRGRGRPSVKRESEPVAVASPLHPAAATAAGGGMYSSGQGYHSSGPAFPSYGLGGHGQSTLARLTHAAAMAEGMGSRGDRSRPDDYYQVYSEYYAAQEAYNRLVSQRCCCCCCCCCCCDVSIRAGAVLLIARPLRIGSARGVLEGFRGFDQCRLCVADTPTCDAHLHRKHIWQQMHCAGCVVWAVGLEGAAHQVASPGVCAYVECAHPGHQRPGCVCCGVFSVVRSLCLCVLCRRPAWQATP